MLPCTPGGGALVADEKNEEPTSNLLVGMAGLAGVEVAQIGYSWDAFRL